MSRVYEIGKDDVGFPCIELGDGTIITDFQILLKLIKLLVQKGIITQREIKDI